jgi:hypothetical protein
VLYIAACLWDKNRHTFPFSQCYDESWVEKLYRGFKRNLKTQFRFICFTDRLRDFNEPIGQEILSAKEPSYGCLIEPFKLNLPMMICGLDMVVMDRLDHMAEYCLTKTKIAAPLHPCHAWRGFINPIVFVPRGHREVFDKWNGENDMEWINKFDIVDTETLWPDQIKSWKLHDMRVRGRMQARICYFHGEPKTHIVSQSTHWVAEAWK